MENWQFLIQKQGERTWRLLESPNSDVQEGRYRVVARSGRPNTEVEVRVSYLAVGDASSKRRVHKRSRRTNSEGLMAVMPFTHFQPGFWELRCSGDLMSDLLGSSWQYSVRLQVTPSDKSQSGDEEPKRIDNVSKIAQSLLSNNTIALPDDKSPLASGIASPVLIENSNIEEVNVEITDENTVIDTVNAKSVENNNHINLIDTTVKKIEIISDEHHGDISLLNNELIRDEHYENTPFVNTEVDSAITELNPPANSSNIEIITQDVSSENRDNAEVLDDSSISLEHLTQESSAEVLSEKIEAETTGQLSIIESSFIEETISPVWLKGESAEEILQNLIDLALPTSESLLSDETYSDSVAQTVELPLILSVETDNYFVRWGEVFCINGRVELLEDVDLEFDEALNLESVCAAQLRIELRSPQALQVISQIRQPLPDKILPFNFSVTVDIPLDCESKLLLADVNFYGVLDGIGEVELLASQSFTITADVSDLVAMSIAIASKPFLIEEESTAIVPVEEETSPPVSLDLELFNLVKAAKVGQKTSPVVRPTPKNTLPPRINPYSFDKSTPERSPQLPLVPGYQPKTSSIALAERPIKRERRLSGSIFPYLRRIKALPGDKGSMKMLGDGSDKFDNQLENQIPNFQPELAVSGDSELLLQQNTQNTTNENLQVTIVEENNREIPVTIQETIENETLSQNIAPNLPIIPGTATIEESTQPAKPKLSPLLKQWIQSQGYKVPETITVEYQDYPQGEEISQESIVESQESIVESQESIVESQESIVESQELIVESQELEESLPLPPSHTPPTSKKLPLPPPPPLPKRPPAWVAKEIVVDDDTEILPEVSDFDNNVLENKENALVPVASSLAISAAMMESLPIPILRVREGEIIAGQSLRVRVELPAVSGKMAVKLWMEDCQMRWLLDGPHLLTNLSPSPSSGLEVTTKLHIPFGCLEIRLGAVLIDLDTQQESDKASIERTVIPPDLPSLRMDEMLNI